MTILDDIINRISAGFNNPSVYTSDTVTILLMVTVMAVYEFIIYRFTSKRSFYSKQFNLALVAIPYFIATIIMTLQSNLVITLGTIGALAIIRFRTAIKDPMDMIYLLWSVHIGITCGSGLFEISVLTSLAVTIVILVLDLIPLSQTPFLLVINAGSADTEQAILKTVKELTRTAQVKSRNLTQNGLDMIIELRTKNADALLKQVYQIEDVTHVSLVAHDGEAII